MHGCTIMNLGLRLLLYASITTGCVAALAGGVHWLVTPDPALTAIAEARPSPIPPRIMESIERKVPLPRQEPEQARVSLAVEREAAPVSPPAELRTAPVSLPLPKAIAAPKVRAVKVTRGSRQRQQAPSTERYVVPVVTSRTDLPF